MALKKIKWLSTGGTISCVKGKKGFVPAATEDQLRRMLEIIENNFAQAQVLMSIDSTDISCENIGEIGEAVNREILSGCGGIVITHGTDTMAYTAAILNKMLENCPVPVILTGSQRPFFEEGSDGKTNLENAFAAALCGDLHGVHILFGDKIIRGGKAYKAYSQSDNAFISPDGEYSGFVRDGEIICTNVSETGKYRFRRDFEEKVGLIKLTPMTAEEDISRAAKLYSGIVIECYGLGGIPNRLLPAIKAAADRGIRFMAISQCLYEGVSMNVYLVGENALSSGVIPGGQLTAEGALAEIMFTEKAGPCK